MQTLIAMTEHAPGARLSPLAAQSSGTGGVFVWVLVLAVVIVVAGVVLLSLRRRVFADDEASSDGLTLADLRRLHAEGRLNDEEFARLRDALIEAARPSEPHAHVRQLKRKDAPPQDAQ